MAKIPPIDPPSLEFREIAQRIAFWRPRSWMPILSLPSAEPEAPAPVYTAEQLLKPEDAARVLCVATKTLAQWRVSGNGPRFSKIGRSVVYKHADLIDFADRQTRSSTSDTGGEK